MAASGAAISVTIEAPCAALADEADLRRLVAHALAAEGRTAPVAVAAVVVDDAAIHDLNRRFLGHDEPTDVLTFPLGEDGPGFVNAGPRQLGEVYVSCERAAAQCAEWGNSPAREVRFLVVHGVLHLLGWDDATPEDRARMLARQEAILAAYEAAR
ncbi:MAG TPA: rRNA maturation RNase YbeY [Thermomicrobiales bacterium]|nr:rRNA maturation RNase YbeY [Thermomicrobiales bacterium]